METFVNSIPDYRLVPSGAEELPAGTRIVQLKTILSHDIIPNYGTILEAIYVGGDLSLLLDNEAPRFNLMILFDGYPEPIEYSPYWFANGSIAVLCDEDLTDEWEGEFEIG